jgi:hypothetical protein
MRARIKQFKDVPPEYKCCDASIAKLQRHSGVQIEIPNQTPFNLHARCLYCKYDLGNLAYYTFVLRNVLYRIEIDLIDIEEGS